MARQLVFENESEMIAWIMEREYLMETLYDMIESEFYGDEWIWFVLNATEKQMWLHGGRIAHYAKLQNGNKEGCYDWRLDAD